MLKVWGRQSSSNVQKVLWLIGELNLQYEHVSVGGKYGGLDTEEFKSLNPHQHIPVIQDDGLVVWESHAILRYLAAKYGRPTFWSEDPGEQSLADRWMDWEQTTFQPDFLGGVFWGFYRTPDDKRDWPTIKLKVDACSKHLSLLDAFISDRDFLLGNTLSLADIPIGALLFRYFELEIERPPMKHVEKWYRKLCLREAYQKHVMLPFYELKGRLEF